MTTRGGKMFFETSSGGGVGLDPILRFLHNLIDLVKMRQAAHDGASRRWRASVAVTTTRTPSTRKAGRHRGDDAQSGTVVWGGGNLRRPISSGPRQKRRLAFGDPTYFFIGRSFVGDR